MTVRILDRAENDLVAGYWFYEAQLPGLGVDFRESLYVDIGGLKDTGGIYRVVLQELPSSAGKTLSIRGVLHCLGPNGVGACGG